VEQVMMMGNHHLSWPWPSGSGWRGAASRPMPRSRQSLAKRRWRKF